MQESRIKSEQIRFASKYTHDRALTYYHRFEHSPRKRFLNWLEQRMVKRGLEMANMPTNILDIPSGTGRFWEVLHHSPHVQLHAADFNTAMIDVGFEKRPFELTQKIQGTIASAFNLPFPDNSVDSIFCLRFIHHISHHDDRIQLLHELARVTSDTVCISSWIDETGIKAHFRLRAEKKRKTDRDYNKFVHHHQEIIQEFRDAGLALVGYTDLLSHISPWRLYVLRKKQVIAPTKQTITNYVCPLCKEALEHDLNQRQFTCHNDKLTFSMHGKFPMLTQRDAIKDKA